MNCADFITYVCVRCWIKQLQLFPQQLYVISFICPVCVCLRKSIHLSQLIISKWMKNSIRIRFRLPSNVFSDVIVLLFNTETSGPEKWFHEIQYWCDENVCCKIDLCRISDYFIEREWKNKSHHLNTLNTYLFTWIVIKVAYRTFWHLQWNNVDLSPILVASTAVIFAFIIHFRTEFTTFFPEFQYVRNLSAF